MFLKAFPDLQELKQKAAQAFPDTALPGQKTFPGNSWPLVILNTQTKNCYRPDIKGPFSIFSNVRGSSWVIAGGRKVKISENSFFISNRAQPYTLEIETTEPTEIFNLHLGCNLWEDFVYAGTQSSVQLLDNPTETITSPGLTEFPNLLQLQTPAITAALEKLQALGRSGAVSRLPLEEHLLPLLQALANQKQDLVKKAQQLPQLKASSRAELFRRVSLSTDYLLSFPEANLTLEELAGIACLSKFHFLRAFAAVHGTTPHQFLLQYRISQSRKLLQHTQLPVGEVALRCGYADLAVFSRTFRKTVGSSPQLFRKMV